MNITGERALAKAILLNANKFEWTLQGFGMLRLHLPNDHRLHVWDDRFAVPNVSVIHDHLQWGLRSTILSGGLQNRLYRPCKEGAPGAEPMHAVTLKPGVGTHFKDEIRDVFLCLTQVNGYRPGESYEQQPDEIHESRPGRGTVTLMAKEPSQNESATVYWPRGTDWVSAEPRIAGAFEVHSIVSHALSIWQDS